MNKKKNIFKNSLLSVFILTIAFSIQGCEAIGDIFKAGIWVGVLAVVAVFAIIAFIAMLFKK